MQRLLGHLAQFATFSKQGELLCTQSLAFLLRDGDRHRAFCAFAAASANCTVPEVVRWRAEVLQTDRGRPDLEGCGLDGKPLIKVEGKLDAVFGEGQLTSYVSELCRNECHTILLILVPKRRQKEACDYMCQSLGLTGIGPWSLPVSGRVSAAVISWEDVLELLESESGPSVPDDVVQLRSMYRVLNGDDMEPLTTDEDVLRWRERSEWWNKLVDVTSRSLRPLGEKVGPLGLEGTPVPYYRRYVCRRISGVESCFSIGARDPFKGFRTPLWLRFHTDTGYFHSIARNFERAASLIRLVQSQGHLWFPLEVPMNADRNTMITALGSQVRAILDVAYPSTELVDVH